MNSRQTGFTIIELMVSLLVLSILFAAAVPSFREFTRNNRVIAAQNDLITAINLARSEALKRSSPVTVCASEDGENCSDDTDWSKGWIVTVPGGGLVQMWPAIEGDISIKGASDLTELNYQAIGTVSSGGAVEIWADGCSGKENHRITVLVAGTPQSDKVACPEEG
jgi:type IV fimbrial biogenesis protein FimT